MTDRFIASRKHTTITLLIVAAITLVGIQQRELAASVATSRVILYISVIALQLLWVRYISIGMRGHGHAVAELVGTSWRPRSIASDVVFGAVGFFAARGVAHVVADTLGDAGANAAFLLPNGAAASVLWVLVSMVAGLSEEIVYRGYLQRQLTALTNSVALGVVLQAAAFGISHSYQGLPSMAVTGSYGLVLGLLARFRGNVRAGIIAHAATDIVGGLLRF